MEYGKCVYIHISILLRLHVARVMCQASVSVQSTYCILYITRWQSRSRISAYKFTVFFRRVRAVPQDARAAPLGHSGGSLSNVQTHAARVTQALHATCVRHHCCCCCGGCC